MTDGEKFHVYEPKEQGVPWKYCIAFATDDTVRMVHIGDWCLDTFGEPGDNLYYINSEAERWHNVIPYGEIYLRSDAELTMFTLKWIEPSL